jgi:1,4-alpha-glucan branching enzyme
MVQALHTAGIGVVMDVVYNHTSNLKTPFNQFVPGYFTGKLRLAAIPTPAPVATKPLRNEP